jgi:iron-regulated transporter 1
MAASKMTFEIEQQEERLSGLEKEQAGLVVELEQLPGRSSWIAPLCISHAAAAWGERSWEFGAGLLLLHLADLRLAAILVLTQCAVCTLLGPRIGRAVDRASFLGSAISTLAVQSIGIFHAGIFLWAFDGSSSSSSVWLAAAVIACSVVARLGSLGSTIATEKKWAMALSHQHSYGRLQEGETNATGEQKDSDVLARINARLRCIDLVCNLCAPIAVGFLLESTSPAMAAMSIAAFNAVAWPIEVACLVWIHRRYRDVLQSPNERQTDGCTLEINETPCKEWSIYYKQSIFPSALALAVLYLSVVSFGTLMTAWLAASGFHAGHLGLARALAALSGIMATTTTPHLVQKMGVESAGVRYIWFMWACILPCTLAALSSHTHPKVLWAVIASVILSRFGLWGFDLCVTQMLQERVEQQQQIGAINGVQVALQNAFDALAALSCVLWPDHFAFLILGSLGSVTVAALLHTFWRS